MRAKAKESWKHSEQKKGGQSEGLECRCSVQWQVGDFENDATLQRGRGHAHARTLSKQSVGWSSSRASEQGKGVRSAVAHANT